jgi:virulence-associated protein VapD
MSQKIKDACDVCRDLKQSILNDLDNGIERTLDDVDALTRAGFKSVAGKRKVKESTIRDHCTRQLDMNAKEFYDSLKDCISSQDNTLFNKLVSHACDIDDDYEIDKLKKELISPPKPSNQSK